MKFDRLQASILNNADQMPSLYMAVCMVEALFADIETACGKELSHCPVGDEKLPSKLIWLCNNIRDIYTDNSDSLQRNRARLDSVIGRLDQIFAELEELEGISQRLEDQQAQYDDLQEQLETRKADAFAYEKLKASCDRADQQLELLRQFDPQAATAELAALTSQISALENEKNTLSAQLEQAAGHCDGLRQEVDSLKHQNEDALRQIDSLNGQLEQGGSTATQLQAQLDSLREGRTGLDAVHRQLSADIAVLQGEIARLESSKTALEGQLEQAQPRTEALRQQVSYLSATEEALKQEFQTLTGKVTQTEQEVACLRTELEVHQTELTELESEHRQLIQTRDETKEAYAQLCARVSSFREEELEPAQALLENVRQQVAVLDQNKNDLDLAYAQAKNIRGQLTLDIARQKEENETLRGKLELSRENLEALKQEKRKLDDTLSDCLSTLENLQDEVSLLDTRKLPEVRHLQQQEILRREELLKSIADTETQRAALRVEITKLEQQLPKLAEDLQNDRVVYDALTASYTSSSKELEDLERQITELRSNSNEEKLEIYRKQLEQTQRQLETIQLECQRIEQENALQQKKLEDGQNERARLLELKRRHDSGLEATQKQLRELEFAGSEKYVREVAALEERAKLLENVRIKLGASVANMHRILGNAPVEAGTTLEDRFLRDLRDLQQHIESLRSALLNCARSLKLEER